MARVGLDDFVEDVTVDEVRLLPGKVAQVLELEKAIEAINESISSVQFDRQGCNMLLMSRQIARRAEEFAWKTTTDFPAVYVSMASQYKG